MKERGGEREREEKKNSEAKYTLRVNETLILISPHVHAIRSDMIGFYFPV